MEGLSRRMGAELKEIRGVGEVPGTRSLNEVFPEPSRVKEGGSYTGTWQEMCVGEPSPNRAPQELVLCCREGGHSLPRAWQGGAGRWIISAFLSCPVTFCWRLPLAKPNQKPGNKGA